MDGMESELRYESPLDPAVGERHRWLAGLLAARPGELVADLGCGDGVTAVSAGCRATGRGAGS
jgi:hypothetical protein